MLSRNDGVEAQHSTAIKTKEGQARAKIVEEQRLASTLKNLREPAAAAPFARDLAIAFAFARSARGHCL